MESFRKLGTERDRLTALLAETAPEAPAVLPKQAAANTEERTGALFRRFRIMVALDWIENAGKASTAESCHSLEEFIEMTRPPALTGWNDDTILIFIEGIDLLDGAVAVRLKAGITVTVAVP